MKHKVLKALALASLLSTVSAEGPTQKWDGFYSKLHWVMESQM
jgi:hypothetical protein